MMPTKFFFFHGLLCLTCNGTPLSRDTLKIEKMVSSQNHGQLRLKTSSKTNKKPKLTFRRAPYINLFARHRSVQQWLWSIDYTKNLPLSAYTYTVSNSTYWHWIFHPFVRSIAEYFVWLRTQSINHLANFWWIQARHYNYSTTSSNKHTQKAFTVNHLLYHCRWPR